MPDPRLRHVLGRIRRSLGLTNEPRLPRISKVRAGVTVGRFEVTTPTEAFRVEQYGGEESFLLRILDELTAGDVLYDIGACVGMVTINAALRGVRVVAFEPDPAFRERLRRNLRLNSLGGVQVEEWAVSDVPGEAVLFTDGVDGYSPSLRDSGDRARVAVRTDTIDRAWSEGTIPAADVIKMDIEGAEILALRGMKALCSSSSAPRRIFLEVHPGQLVDFGASADDVTNLLDGLGYRVVERWDRGDQMHWVCGRS
jgi:FkbM family methyltransferase